MDPHTRMEIEWQCRNLCYEFAYCIDSRQYPQLAGLFTPNGIFDRVGQMLRGRDAIVEALNERSAELRTRHVCNNIHFSEVGAELARSVVYNTTLVGRGDPPTKPVQYSMSQGVLLEFRDVYRKTSEGWRIAERLASTVLTHADMPHH